MGTLLAGTWLAREAAAQPVGASGGDFSVPFSEQGRQTAKLTGQGWKIQPDGTVLLQTARVENQDPGGNTNANVIVLATNCVADLRQNLVWSTDGLGLRTADGQFALSGVGFTWSQGRNELVVSNQVRTEVRKPAPPGQDAVPLAIRSDAFRFNYASNVVTFRGQVHAVDPEMEVRSGQLVVRRSASGKFDRLLAEDAVQITRRADASVTSSQRAEYRLEEGGEWLEFSGAPRWQDAEREARAERFEWWRAPGEGLHFLRAVGEARIRLPAGTNALTIGPLGEPAPAPSGSAEESQREDHPTAEENPGDTQAPRETIRFLELSAGEVTLALPATNGPVAGLVALTNVVLAAAADGWQAVARQAVLTNGWLELSGAPAWTQGDRSVQGDVLRLNTQHRAFAAHGNARLQLPATAFGTAWPGPEGPAARPPVFRTNQFVVVESAQAEFAGACLRFAPPVRARWFETDLLLGQLDCRDLTVRYPDRLERLTAAGEVRLGQFARPGRPPLERHIACDQLDLVFDDHGRVRELSATGGVRGQQTERLPGTPEPRLTRIEAERIEARFGRQTNQLERATAQGQVRIERDARKASGERADYSGAEGRLFLMGQPEVTSPEGSIHNATTLIWDTRRSRVSGQGPYRIEWRQGLTNVTVPRVMGSPR